MVSLGCSKPKSEAKTDPKGGNNAPDNVKKSEPMAVATGPANNTRSNLSKGKNGEIIREPLWYVEWQSANLAVVNGNQSGDMFKVKGNVFEKGVIASDFFADHAEADKAANRLILDGGIVITSKKTQTTMKAKKVEWLADPKVFKASGEVTVDGRQGVIGPVDVLYADSELKKVASSLKYFSKK